MPINKRRLSKLKRVEKALNKHKVYKMLSGDPNPIILLSTSTVRVPLAKKGQWHHDAYGLVEFGDKDFENIIDNYKSNSLGFVPYITYGHLDEEHNSTDSDRKRGNLKDLFIQENILYGDFDVKEDTYHSIKKGEYEYSSGEFLRNYLDKDSGTRKGTAFMRVALTNSPFIPFGDTKVQALSQISKNNEDNKDNTQTDVFIISLSNSPETSKLLESPTETESLDTQSLDTQSIIRETKENKNMEEIIEEIQEQPVVEDPSPTESKDSIPVVEEKSAESTKAIEDAVLGTVIPVEVVEKNSSEKPNTNVNFSNSDTTDPNSLTMESAESMESTQVKEDKKELNIQDLVSQVKDIYAEQLKTAQETITRLTEQVESLANKLNAQEQVTQAFSANMSKAAEQALYKRLSDAGVSPANVQKFSTLKSAIESASLSSNVVKLSNNAGQVIDSNLIEAIADVISSIASEEPVTYQQFGVSKTKPSTAGFEDIIKRNKDKAGKRQLG